MADLSSIFYLFWAQVADLSSIVGKFTNFFFAAWREMRKSANILSEISQEFKNAQRETENSEDSGDGSALCSKAA